ncbi:MAG TPA: hypothetical protein VFJ02_07765 [Vicinamibacterales bacterium]|nr:hypothetical protein [Vicinamibacterales bacterium]
MAAAFDRRAKALHRSLNSILGPDLRRKLLTHPAIAGIALDESADVVTRRPLLWWSGRTPPNYLAPQSVAIALADIVRETPSPGDRLERLLRSFKEGNHIDAEVLFRLEKWFAEQMERTSSQYKRWTQLWTLLMAIALTGAFDLDAVRIVSELNRNTVLRTAIADRVSSEVSGKTLDQLDTSVRNLSGLPVGWTQQRWAHLDPITALAGWFVSVVALGLGSPFWFDLVNKLVNLRQTGARPTNQVVAQ